MPPLRWRGMPGLQAFGMDRGARLRNDPSERDACGRIQSRGVPGLRFRHRRRTHRPDETRGRRHAPVFRKRSPLPEPVPGAQRGCAMKLPLSWLKNFVSIDASPEEIARRLSYAGLVVENVEKLTAEFGGVFAAKVLQVEKHPNADRLNLCDVDAGEKGHFKVVCGAPNVKAGMIAPLALVGAQLGKEPPLEAAVIRGVQSEGMLCSERELGLSQDHAGILALGADAPLGGEVAAYLHLDDIVLDVEITPNRGDCLSILGLAREVAALFGGRLRAPRLRAAHSAGSADSAQFSISVSIDAPDLCPRYAALAMTGIKIGPSPAWLKRRLELCGMRALNNVVDATNYVMLELGQPLHAFDFAKIAGGKIVVRRAGDTREFVTLDKVTRTLESNDLMIADGEKPLAIAGVMGGLNSEV